MTELTGTHARTEIAQRNDARHSWNRTYKPSARRHVDPNTGLTVDELAGVQARMRAEMYARLALAQQRVESTP